MHRCATSLPPSGKRTLYYILYPLQCTTEIVQNTIDAAAVFGTILHWVVRKTVANTDLHSIHCTMAEENILRAMY